MTDAVKTQYEEYPYPARDPKDEAHRLVTGSPSHLFEVVHHAWGGRVYPNPRVLFAGGGTGDGLIMFAEHCAMMGLKADITYLDLSSASRAVAEARAKARKLHKSIRFVTGSLLELPALAPGPYDYIDCCGVLHHLPDPLAGLKTLAAQLSPRGGMGLMLYAPHGRTGVYPLQAALRALTQGMSPHDQVAFAKNLLKELPATNWFLKNTFVDDHNQSDAGLYDLLLHSQDRAFRVDEIYDLLDAADLALGDFIEPIAYDPVLYLRDAAAIARARALAPRARQALAEDLAGSMKTHVFYARPKARAQDAPNHHNKNARPHLREVNPNALANAMGKGKLVASFIGLRHEFPISAPAARLAQELGRARSVAELETLSGLDPMGFASAWDEVYRLLYGLNLLTLRV